MRKALSLSVLLLLTAAITYGQDQKRVVEGKPGMYPSFVLFSSESSPAFAKGRIVLTDLQAKVTGYSSTTRLAGYEKDISGGEHYRYQQVINGIAVEHAVYVVHTMREKVFAQNGKWIKDVPSSLPAATLSESSALGYALQ